MADNTPIQYPVQMVKDKKTGQTLQTQTIQWPDGNQETRQYNPTTQQWDVIDHHIEKDLKDAYEAKVKDEAAKAKEEGSGGKRKPLMLNGTAYIDDPDNPGHLIPMPGAPAPGTASPGTAPAAVSAEAKVQQAGVAQEKADTQKAYDDARIAVLTGELNNRNYATQVDAYARKLETMVQLGQLDTAQKKAMLEQWVAGATATISAQQAATAQQNAETSAGNLGVARGSLGVSQETADTERERVVQTAGQNAVANTISLLSHYIPTSGPNDPFFTKFAGQLNQISGGKSNYTASDFMSPAPDLRSIADQASAQAVARMKGGVLSTPAPATAAATSVTAVPTAPAPMNLGAPPSVAPGPATSAAALAPTVFNTAPPVPPNPAQVQTTPYLGPVTPVQPVGAGGVGNS